MRYHSIVAAALGAALIATTAFGQASKNQPSDNAAPVSTFKEAVEKTKGNTGTRPAPPRQPRWPCFT